MSTQFTSPVGRLVQGGFKLQPKKDIKGNLVKDSEGKQVEECFMALAIPKFVNGQPNPEIGPFYSLFVAQAQASFPHLFPNGATQATHPRFAMKWQDGDGKDSTGQSVADKPGFAGCWVVKMATRYAPRVYARDSHGNLVQLEDPEKIIKTGYRISVGGTIDGNGVEPNNTQAVPGLFVSPNLVLFVAPDEEIVSGPDPNAVFANVASQPGVASGAVAAGLHSPPQPAAGGAPMPGAASTPAGGPPLPGGAPTPSPQAPAPGGTPMPGSAAPTPTPTGGPPLPGGAPVPTPAPATPQYAVTASAQGATLEQLLALGWTHEGLLAAGHIVRTA